MLPGIPNDWISNFSYGYSGRWVFPILALGIQFMLPALKWSIGWLSTSRMSLIWLVLVCSLWTRVMMTQDYYNECNSYLKSWWRRCYIENINFYPFTILIPCHQWRVSILFHLFSFILFFATYIEILILGALKKKH